MKAITAVKGAIAAGMLWSGCFAQQPVRVKDVAAFNGLEELQLYGYGLVVGLAGTGDRIRSVFTTQTIKNMLKNMGIELPDRHMQTKNVAAVMVTAVLHPFKRRGTRLDVTVSSIGDAKSLEGGTLILTPLQGPQGEVYASAQGPLATGGYDVRNRGLSHIKKNHVLVGRIPDGALVQREYEYPLFDQRELSISLQSPDFSSCLAMAGAINALFADAYTRPIATPKDASTVMLDFETVSRDTIRSKMGLVEFLSKIENVTFQIAHQARIVINERTGTIVAGGDVRISEVAVTHGGVKIEIVNVPEVIEPQPFTRSMTEVVPNPQMVVEEKDMEMVVLNGTTTVSDLAQALNSLGVSPRDVISIFQAIKQAGSLHGQLIIM